MIVSWSRSASSSDAEGGVEERRAADYAPAAAPERQPALATILPTGIGGLSLAAFGILLIAATAISPSLAEVMLGRPLVAESGRFARTVAAVRSCFDLNASGSLATWAGHMLLVAAALVAWAVRGMRRLRRDDYNGRFRAWGWMAALLLVATVAAQVPLGELVAALIADATGVAFGPGGLGWWIALSTVILTAVSLWAVLPLHERVGTSLWLGLSAALWALSLGCTWVVAIGSGSLRIAVIGRATWTFAAATALIAMLSAARSVIREVRGEAAKAAPRRGAKSAATAPVPADAWGTDGEREDHAHDENPVVFAESPESPEFTDGSEESSTDGRKLTKAERKRLKRMSRLQQAG